MEKELSIENIIEFHSKYIIIQNNLESKFELEIIDIYTNIFNKLKEQLLQLIIQKENSKCIEKNILLNININKLIQEMNKIKFYLQKNYCINID